MYGSRIENLPSDDDLTDPKTRLQEWLQARGFPPPAYVVSDIRGAPHAQTFAVSCEVPALEIRLTGSGSSRRVAEQSAAALVLAQLASAAHAGESS
jgi:ribonuclease-3